MNILLLIILIMLSFSLSLISRICFFFLSLSPTSYLLPSSSNRQSGESLTFTYLTSACTNYSEEKKSRRSFTGTYPSLLALYSIDIFSHNSVDRRRTHFHSSFPHKLIFTSKCDRSSFAFFFLTKPIRDEKKKKPSP